VTNAELARDYFAASARNDIDALESMRHADWHLRWPSTGELVRNSAAYRAIHEAYPGGYPHFNPDRILGSEDRYVLSPANTVVRVAGEGDVWWGEARLRYADDSEWDLVKMLELREGRVFRETDYWAPVMDPAGWRAPWVDQLPRQADD
jgi:ketosteroid isomerase-like protein